MFLKNSGSRAVTTFFKSQLLFKVPLLLTVATLNNVHQKRRIYYQSILLIFFTHTYISANVMDKLIK